MLIELLLNYKNFFTDIKKLKSTFKWSNKLSLITDTKVIKVNDINYKLKIDDESLLPNYGKIVNKYKGF